MFFITHNPNSINFTYLNAKRSTIMNRKTILKIGFTLCIFTTCTVNKVTSSYASPLKFASCKKKPGVQCATLNVSLDWKNQQAGTAQLHVERVAKHSAGKTALIFLAGGPGDASTSMVPDVYSLFPTLKDTMFVTFDERGTGASRPLVSCKMPFLRTDQNNPDIAIRQLFLTVGNSCAQQIGPKRSFYGTNSSVEDIKALKDALGVEKVALFGVSYGTYVAERYAIRYPETVDRLILDSALPPEGVDPLSRGPLHSTERILQEICARGACAGITNNPVGDLRTVLDQMQRTNGLKAKILDEKGHATISTLPRTTLADALFSASGGAEQAGVARALLIPLIHAAAQGKPSALVSQLMPPKVYSPPGLSSDNVQNGIAMAALCTDLQTPWDWNASVEDRLNQLKMASSETPGLSSPFPPIETGFSNVYNMVGGLCLSWPNDDHQQNMSNTLPPQVPVLFVSGTQDMLTPLEDAQRMTATSTHFHLLKVSGYGHAPSGAAPCVTKAYHEFFAVGQVKGACPQAPRIAPIAVLPKTFNKIQPLDGTHGRIGKMLKATAITLDFLFYNSQLFSENSGGGFYKGFYKFKQKDSYITYTYHQLSYVPGVSITGAQRINIGQDGKITMIGWTKIKGPHGLKGRVKLTTDGNSLNRMIGMINGQHVDVSIKYLW